MEADSVNCGNCTLPIGSVVDSDSYGLIELDTCSESSENCNLPVEMDLSSIVDSDAYGLIELDTCSESTCSESSENGNLLVEMDLSSIIDSSSIVDSDAYGLIELDTCSESTCSESSEYNTEDIEMISQLQSSPTQVNCCSQRCTAKFSLIEMENIQSVFQRKSQTEQRQFILDQLTVAPISVSCSAFSQVKQLNLSGKRVCKKAFVVIVGTSYSRLKCIYDAWQGGASKLPGRIRTSRCLSAKHTTMVAWLEAYANRLGEKMPHLDQIHLPHFLTKKAVYEIMKSTSETCR